MNYEIVPLVQGSSEWLAFRKNHIGASDASAIMGCSAWKTRNQLWKEKLGLIQDQPVNFAMQRGIDLEPEARQKFSELMNIDLQPLVAKRTDIPYIAASYDGVDKTRCFAVEIKCPLNSSINNDIPDHYIAQLQHQMFVLNLQYIYYYSYHPEYSFHKMVKRDNEYINHMLAEHDKFWDKVLSFEQPDEDEFIDRTDDQDWVVDIRKLSYIKKEIKRLEREEKETTESLKKRSDEKPSKGAGFKFSLITRKGSIDYDAMLKQHNIDSEMYRKPATTYWKLSEEK